MYFSPHKCYFNNNGQTIIEDGKIRIYGRSTKFCSQAKAILDSGFANEIYAKELMGISNDKAALIDIDSYSIRYLSSLNNNVFEYRPFFNEQVNLSIPDGVFSDKRLQDIMNSTFQKE